MVLRMGKINNADMDELKKIPVGDYIDLSERLVK